MPDPLMIVDMATALVDHLLPSVTVWNRLEGRPRTIEFDRALRAEIRDPLWMLTRQWQLGEFHGDDAGSPVFAKVQLTRSTLDGFQARDGTPVAMDHTRPLETTVEQRPIDLFSAGGAIDLRLAMGRRFLKLIPAVYHQRFIDHYAFELPDPEDPADTERIAHLEVWSLLQAVAGRAMDGYRLYAHLTASPSNTPWAGISVLDDDKPALTDAATRFLEWLDALFDTPLAEQAWDPTRLEHRFAVTTAVADGDKRLVAEEYPGGRLDWTAFSVDPSGARGSGALTDPFTVIPTRTQFNGMPDQRWWALEDGVTNLGDVQADSTDLAKLLFLEFALAYGNDWFTIPVELPVGSVATVAGLAVTNVFGERVWVEAAGRGEDDDWRRWSMFTMDVRGTDPEPAELSLFVPPTISHASEGAPLEDVILLRDEVANLVWGIERVVAIGTGRGRRGSEAAAEALAHRTRLIAGTPTTTATAPAAPISYRVMTSVPENWIPFIAVHVPGDIRETQLQRAAMPRLIKGAPTTDRVRPRTSLLRVGLDQTPATAFYLHEEEVPRAGTQVEIAFQRARWRDGRPVLWLAARRETGRGEGASNLAFDHLQAEASPPPT